MTRRWVKFDMECSLCSHTFERQTLVEIECDSVSSSPIVQCPHCGKPQKAELITYVVLSEE